MKLKSLFRVNRIFVQKWCQRIQPVSHVSLLSGMSGVVGRSPFLLVHKPTCKIKSALGHIGRVFPRPQHSRRISHLFMNASFNFGDQRLLHTTVDEEEVAKFRSLVQSWWDVNGEFQALHSLNDLRVPLIRDGLVKRNGCQSLLSSQPLADTFILDVGCGGGILSEPLARLGATVIGIDAASENIQVAREHASHDRLLWKRINYICATAEELLSTNGEAFDAVIASEVLEHVSNVEGLVATCSQLTKPAGSIFFTTINKTWLSFALAIVGAEDIAGVVPSGTHDWNKFIPPQDLQRFLHATMAIAAETVIGAYSSSSTAGYTNRSFITHGQSEESSTSKWTQCFMSPTQCTPTIIGNCQTKLVHGMIFNPVTKRWFWGTPTTCNYAVHAVKKEATTLDV